ncbi:NAD(P)/FAD-dependent oxidoreductase [Bradyrhizobium sp. ISRA432]|uniref:NAD(P)/FAD-dependent oxidoreductase n=1 Tax=unclassified Bradyrhizobium TaxID=2631580 RepID=UPI0024799E99|nr:MULTISPECIES: NAD(P)/FAD-dependent oxidoreductase [unclassified Bradyrhizobium]WGR82805.1 NAD(P)/FAD-dependent oxidoreductase [Bradyrhizobium sp. ISRA430]WGR90503.1 NAD(P)/FAD-dependent oxidoreductase [Bradyrhizobium sp. ISRA432]
MIVIGGGPAGSTVAWSLARRGVRVAVIERAIFPREKVCGDFVEPAGLRILESMGVREALNVASLSPITSTRIYFGPKLGFRGAIPYYQADHGLPPHGFVVPRHILDQHLLDRARAMSAKVYAGYAAGGIRREDGLIHVNARAKDTDLTLRSRLIVGADGAESLVARAFNLESNDRAHISIAQRAYVEGISVQDGEATVWFDEDIVPGYGWLFPMAGGRANIGVGTLSETCSRHGHSVPKAFAASIERLRIRHPGCAGIKLVSKPIGGVVKMYGGVGPNYFDGGVLIGDAGAFADPMTGEGITQGMESALIASSTLLKSLELGKFDASFLATFEREFRSYFDPGMLFLGFCAAVMRNWHFREFWMRSAMRGCERAMASKDFARTAGAGFGGLNVHPLGILREIGASILHYLSEGALNALRNLVIQGTIGNQAMLDDLVVWQSAWKSSVDADPDWHAAWVADITKRAAKLGPSLLSRENPRVRGLLV